MFKDYVKIKKPELLNIFYISITLSILFSISIIRFTNLPNQFIELLIKIFIFIFILLYTRLLFIKAVAYKNAFEIDLKITYLDRYYLNTYDKLSYYKKKIPEISSHIQNLKDTFKGIPSTIISFIIYFLTLGLIIYPSLWNYKFNKISVLHVGTRQRFESSYFHNTSDYRFSKALFMGFIFYFLFATILKIFTTLIGLTFYNIFTLILYYIAFISIIPIPASEGYELFRRNPFAWINAIMILIITMIALLIFNNFLYMIIVIIISLIAVFMVLLWKDLMK